MTRIISIAVAALLAACSGVGARSQGGAPLRSRWQGYLLREGLRAPVALELSAAGTSYDGWLSAGDNYVALSSVRFKGNDVHFELPGGDQFDGVAAGDTMAGSISGHLSGALSLTRVVDADRWNPYPNGP